MNIKILKFNKDNYAYLITKGSQAAIVDPGIYSDIEKHISSYNLKLILLTHRHYDHSGGVNKLLIKNPYCKVIDTNSKINSFFGEEFKIIKTPGHTNDSCCFYFPKSHCLFTGDTLFTSCCGRNFEGTYKEMHNSLKKIAALPKETLIYPGHELLEHCISFIDYIGNDSGVYKDLLNKEHPSVAVTLDFELINNPFLTDRFEDFRNFREMKNSI